MDQSSFDSRPFSTLTPREREVMLGIVEGMSSKYIAFEMALSKRTVEAHRARIFSKTRVRNAVQLTRLWFGRVVGHSNNSTWPVYRFCKSTNTQEMIGPSGMRVCSQPQCGEGYRCVLDTAGRSTQRPCLSTRVGSSAPADF